DAGGLIEAVFFCPDANDASPCRKPNPGMLTEVAARLRVSLENVPFVCDTQRDIDAALAVGAKPLLVRTGKGLRTLERLAVPVPVVDDLAAAVDLLLVKGD
nr:HAD hydrolase-like protein [Pseudomonadota bacterium]